MAQVVFVDLTAADCSKKIQELAGLSTVRGVRQIVGRAPAEDSASGTQNLLDNQQFLRGLRCLQEYGLSFDLQLIPELMPKMAEIIADIPDVPFALCHAGSPHDRSTVGLKNWAVALARLAALPNVTCKLSGLGMFAHDWTAESIRPIVDTCLQQFGADRCMYGSNFPVDRLYSDYETLVKAYRQLLPIEMQQQVFHDTAAAFYRLHSSL